MAQVLQGIEIQTESINYAATLVAFGCHLRSITARGEEVPPRCAFTIVWSREPFRALASVPTETLVEAHAALEQVISQLDCDGGKERAADLAAIKALLADETDLEVSADLFSRLWSSRRVRIEPQVFDRARTQVTRRMRDAQREAIGGTGA
jgi:hypothetical protein